MTLYKMTKAFYEHNKLNAYFAEYILYKTPYCYWYLTRMDPFFIKLGISTLKTGHINKELKNTELLQQICTFTKYNELPTKYPELFV